MFKKFSVGEHVSNRSKVKSSIQRNIRGKILEQLPNLEPIAEEILPKKAPMIVAKCHNHIQIVIHNDEPLFFSQRNGPWLPTLRILHKFPKLLPKVQCDKGAIRFVLDGANVMCRGLTSKGASLSVELPSGVAVAIMAEGKEHAMAVGTLARSTTEIREQNEGIGVENAHYIGDDLWHLSKIE